MKKTILILAAGLLAMGCASTQHVQTTDNNFSELARVPATGAGSARSVRNFWKMFGESKNEKWYSKPDLSLAEFEDQGISYRVVFDKRGNWLYTLKQYTEKELPEEVQVQVKRGYPDYSMGWVKEVNEAQRIVYLIHIENDREWKTIQAEDGGMEAIQEYTKK
jgi:hypothetical protein